MANKRLIVGNWKMNPGTLDEAKRLARKIRRASDALSRTIAVICPPFVFIPSSISKRGRTKLHVGSQTVSDKESGAHTGEVSAAMLKDVGVEYAIIGHSEERAAGDTDARISERLQRALDAGLTPIVCVGEKTRDEGGAHFDFLREQVKATFDGVPKRYGKDIILAYEPVWAIGAKEPMAPEQIYEMALFVKKAFADIFGPELGVKTIVLYGGSVNFRNAGDIMRVGKVDGLLVGRESVNAAGFVELLKAVDAVE